MSWASTESHWRCPICDTDNKYYNNGWTPYIEFKEYPKERYTREKCKWCGKEYFVSESEPNPYYFKMNRGACKNDYIKDLVLSTNRKLTMKINSY